LNTNKITSAQATTIANNAAAAAVANVAKSGGPINPNAMEFGVVTINGSGDVEVVDRVGFVAADMYADDSIDTSRLKNGAVTAAKTSGVIGKIPSGSQTSTTYATIWVQ
jgi:hypothetical protein